LIFQMIFTAPISSIRFKRLLLKFYNLAFKFLCLPQKVSIHIWIFRLCALVFT